MAIAEPEPKKNEVAVTSGGKRKELASSSTSSVKTYDLYSSIKDFSFHMPGGWNDLDVGIFLEACWENAENLQNRTNNDNILWQQIAKTGASKSSNPVLFTVNSCMEVAQCLRQYVTRNMSKMNNDSFKKFCCDIISLLPFFPPVISDSLKKRGNLSEKQFIELCYFEELIKEPLLESKINRAVLKHLPDIQSGKAMAWEELRKTIKDYTEFDFDARSFLEMLKRALLEDVELEQDPQKRKDIFLQAKPYLVSIFDLLHPTNITKNSFLSSLDNTVNSENDISSTAKDEEHRLPSQGNGTDSLPERRLSCQSKKDPDSLPEHRYPSQSNGTDSLPEHRLLSQNKDIDSSSEHGLPSQSNGTDSLVEPKLLSQNKDTVCLEKNGTNSLATGSRISESKQIDNDLPVKRKRGRPRKVTSQGRPRKIESTGENEETVTKVAIGSEDTYSTSIEPSSTTLLDEGVCLAEVNHSQQVSSENEKEGTKIILNEPLSTENVLPDVGNELEESSSPVHRGRKKREDRWKKKLSLPKRILPSREARNRITSPVKPQAEKMPIYERQTNQVFNNISETDGFEPGREEDKRSHGFETTLRGISLEQETVNNLRLARKVKITRTLNKTLANPDTTTNDLDDNASTAISSPQNSASADDDVPSVKRLTRQSKKSVQQNIVKEEKVDSKPLVVQPDSTLNPFVKLQVLKKTDLQISQEINIPSSSVSKPLKHSVPSSSVSKPLKHSVPSSSVSKPLKHSVPSSISNNPESAVLGKEVPSKVYNPNSDSAKIGPESCSPRSKTLGKKRPCPVPSKSSKRNKHKNVVRNHNSSSESDDTESKYRGTKSGVNNDGSSSSTSSHETRSDTFSEPVPGPSNRRTSKVEVPRTSITQQNYVAPTKPSVKVSARSRPVRPPEPPSSLNLPPEMIETLMRHYIELMQRRTNPYRYSDNDEDDDPDRVNQPPPWLDSFMEEMQRHHVWKLQQFARMQEEVVDLERRKIRLLERLATTLDNDNLFDDD